MGPELERIEQLCNERGWSHYKLAKMMNMAPNNVGNLFNRESTPSIYTLRRVCDAFEITLSQFFAGENEAFTLTADQKRILSYYSQLDRNKKMMAEAYLSGLAARDLE